jgi:hypothetical protein
LSVLSGTKKTLKNLSVMLSGSDDMGRLLVARVFFSGDTILMQHGKNRVGLLTTSEWASGRVLTPMTIDQQRDGLSMPLPAVDWELYRRLKAEGRLNLLLHFWRQRLLECSSPRLQRHVQHCCRSFPVRSISRGGAVEKWALGQVVMDARTAGCHSSAGRGISTGR